MEYTDDYRCLDARRWQRGGLLKPGHAFLTTWVGEGEAAVLLDVRAQADRVILSNRHGDGGEYAVKLDWTACTYGGQRVWFLCPATGCGRRVAYLYGGAMFACRHCHRLAYHSQRETAEYRAGRRADKIRAKLDWVPGILNPAGDKPKGMRWNTYYRLVGEYNAAASESLAGMVRRFGGKAE